MRTLLVLLALLGVSLATTRAPVPCTVGTMPNADFASLTDALANCKPDATGEVTLLLAGEFAAKDLDFELLTTAEYVTIEALDRAEMANFRGVSSRFGHPPQLKAITLQDLRFDFEGQNCSLWHSALTAALIVDHCTFSNGICDPVLKIDTKMFSLTRSSFETIKGLGVSSPSVDQIEDLISKDKDGDSLRILITNQKDPFVELDNKKPAYPHPESDYAKLQKGIGHPDKFDEALINSGKATFHRHRPQLTDDLLGLIGDVTAAVEKAVEKADSVVCESQSKLLVANAIQKSREAWSDRLGALNSFLINNIAICQNNEDYCGAVYNAALALERLRIGYPCSTDYVWTEKDLKGLMA